MAALRKKRKLAAVSRKTPKNTRKNQSQNTIDPEMAQEDISQVSAEIEWRVSKILWEEISRTGSRILGELSNIDNFRLKPQVRTCSVAVPGTSRNSNSENREPTGDGFLGDPCPEVRYSSHHCGNLNIPEVEDYSHMVTRGREEIRNRPHRVKKFKKSFPTAPLVILQENEVVTQLI